MNSMTTKQFLEAAQELEKYNLGRLMSLKIASQVNQDVFIKRPPDEVKEALSMNPALCTADVYAARYAKGSSKSIGLQLRAKLVSMRLVPKNCFL